jgi:hypothetical protein
MNNYVKPFTLIKGHNYKIGYGNDTKTVYKLVKVTEKGYKFLNLRTNTCGRQKIMYSKVTNIKTLEVQLWLPANLIIIEIPLAEMEIGICGVCNQMTNHRDGMCLKCIARESEHSVPDFYEEKQHEDNMKLPRIQPQELKVYKHQDLMKELNDMMIRIKRHLFGIQGDTIKPENEELDSLTNKLMAVLREDSEPMVKH